MNTNACCQYIEGLIEQKPDLYLTEIREQVNKVLDIDVSERTISNSLKRRGFTRKKVCLLFLLATRPRLMYLEVSRASIERDEVRRNMYQAAVAEFPPETLVYLDESACNRHTSNRAYAWGPVGDRARQHDYFVRGTRCVIVGLKEGSLAGKYLR